MEERIETRERMLREQQAKREQADSDWREEQGRLNTERRETQERYASDRGPLGVFWELGKAMGVRMFGIKEKARILNILETKECWLCGKKYKRLGWLERHVVLKHGVGA